MLFVSVVSSTACDETGEANEVPEAIVVTAVTAVTAAVDVDVDIIYFFRFIYFNSWIFAVCFYLGYWTIFVARHVINSQTLAIKI